VDLRQYAANGKGTGPTKPSTASVQLGQRTLQGSLLVLVSLANHDDERTYSLTAPPGFGWPVFRRTQDGEITLAVWRWENAPSITGAWVVNGSNRSSQIMLFEITGAAQGSALDRITVQSGRSNQPRSGLTGTLAQADEAVLGFIASRYSSTTQGGFSGGLAKLVEQPAPIGDRYDSDNQRSRLSAHLALPTTATSWELRGNLSTSRDWVAAVVTFRGGSLGPALMTSLDLPDAATFTGGSAELNVFGPMTSTGMPDAVTFDGGSAWIGPGNLQMRLGGPSGLLIGPGTSYRIGKVTGLGGHDVRTSDGEFPLGDGAARGVDLQSSRQILIELNWDDDNDEVLEQLTQDLVAALTPRRDDDFELLFRRPGRPLQFVRCRPVALSDELDAVQLLLRSQTLALLASDPRIYGAQARSVAVPVTPAGATEVTVVSAINAGNGRAYPRVRFDNRDVVEVTGVEMVNATTGSAFATVGAIPPGGGQLVGDMPADVTAASRPVVTLNGQNAYGMWQPPRTPFYLAPGVNAIYLRTTPPGAAVAAHLDYSDTSTA